MNRDPEAGGRRAVQVAGSSPIQRSPSAAVGSEDAVVAVGGEGVGLAAHDGPHSGAAGDAIGRAGEVERLLGGPQVVVAVGGLGSITGSLVAALGLGIVDTATRYLLPGFGTIVFYLAMMAVLTLRPCGLLGRG